ncbi:MAG: hypothetical protein C1941_06530 [Prosthecochloris sp.]|nr:hypothetical protein [Prosthecochloris sp.]
MLMDHHEKKDSGQNDQKKKTLGSLIDSTVTSSYEDLLAIIEARTELIKIEITEKLAIVASLLIIIFFLVAGIIYLIATLALLFGELLGHYYLGYLIISMFCLLTFLLFARISPNLLKNIIHNILLSSHGKKN